MATLAAANQSEDVTEQIARRARQVDAALRDYLARAEGAPDRLAEAMRYSLEAGGKRLRPALVLECCALCGGQDDAAMPAAAAIECVHTFSLIHDDLPGMDDDDLRRGRPTNHKIFGEAMAILAGDALLTFAFELIARDVRPAARSQAMSLAMARGVGWQGMIAGQALDLLAESGAPRLEQVREIHALKTARLMATACVLGGLAADAPADHLAILDRYGHHLGLAFQAVDDLLDVVGSSQILGKTAGKDAKAGKQSLPRVVVMEEGWQMAERLAAEAASALDPFGALARPLVNLARFVVDRTS